VKLLQALFLFILLTACNDRSQQLQADPLIPAATTEPVSYTADIRPIIEQKCIVCHGCFDAPCQLKMESGVGLLRGASKLQAYDGQRKDAAEPTRLYFDAQTEQQWRDLDFHSVLQPEGQLSPLLYRMLELGKRNDFTANSKLPDDLDISIQRKHSCPTADEFDDYAKEHNNGGMPFAVTGLSDKEFSLVRGWLEQGATIDESTVVATSAEQTHIDRIEHYLNQEGLNQQLVARWLYEHLFLAHIYFDSESLPSHYFQLVRSHTPPGQAIDVVHNRLPNSLVLGKFYYRLRPMQGATVHKRHITFLFDVALQQRIDELFYAEEWSVDKLPDYVYENRSNPFLTYQAIPARARYQFLLDHAEYFTRTFIRGPVCRGQIATDVIRDQFWVMYQDPDYDAFITNKAYQDSVIPLLGLPGQDDNLVEIPENWEHYKDKRNEYLEKRNQHYRTLSLDWSSLSAIWHGKGHNDNALLTVFRHFNSASVEKGLIGQTPITLWWMDYPLFERTYYELVVNFDVFGNVAHQLQTRLYFDLIRNGAEHNFLRLLPKEGRADVLADWYQDMAAIKTYFTYAPLDTNSETGVSFETKHYKQELTEKLLTQFSDVNAMANDPINRCNSLCMRQNQPEWIQQVDSALSALTRHSFADDSGLMKLPEVTYVYVKNNEDERAVYTLIRNRYHDNVAFLLGESLRYQPEKDTLTVYPGIIGSYPNFMFSVDNVDIDRFTTALLEASEEEQFDAMVQRWGIRRTHPMFWDVLHDITAWQADKAPLEAGIFDINRYQNL
jgi:hypothetical protein